MINVEEKSAYPYITEFKKEPYKSFALKHSKDIKSFYLKDYGKVKDLVKKFKEEYLNESNLSLESLFWFLLLKKYLKEKIDDSKDEIYAFIKTCEVEILDKDQLGFKSSPTSMKAPNIWSTYYAISCLFLTGKLKEYRIYKIEEDFQRKLRNFIYDHKKDDKFLHCLEKECEIRKKPNSSKTLYYILEIFTMIGIDVRIYKEQFKNLIKDLKKDPNLPAHLLCLKYIDLDSNVKEKDLEYLIQHQKNDGGFSLTENNGQISVTFWILNALEAYSWLLDYNPVGVYSFLNQKFKEILDQPIKFQLENFNEISKLTILLCTIWRKFIEHIERLLFRQLEKNQYIDLKQIETTFGLSHGIEEIILYINLSYTFSLRIVDKNAEFQEYLGKLSENEATFMKEFFHQLRRSSIIPLSEIYKKMRRNDVRVKLREKIFPIIKGLIENNFFKGNIRSKRGFTLKTKYYFYLDFILEKIIISDSKINIDKIYEEKRRLSDIKNDIFNMTLELNSATKKIRDEIESYLLIDEIDYAKQRLKYLVRNSLMEADFLNENIENSFNENLEYINLQASLNNEISTWKKLYSALQKRLTITESNLIEKIKAKEELRNFDLLLDELENKIEVLGENVKKNLSTFRTKLIKTFDPVYEDEKFWMITNDLDEIFQKVNNYDKTIYKISQQITSKEPKIVKKHKRVIEKWVKIKSEFNSHFDYFASGFEFFNTTLQNIKKIEFKLLENIDAIREKANGLVEKNQFKRAAETIKIMSDELIDDERGEIKKINSQIKAQIKNKQKLISLFKHLQENLDGLEEKILDLIASEVNSLLKIVSEERNRAKIEELDSFIIEKIAYFKNKIEEYQLSLNQQKSRKIEKVIQGFKVIISDFDDIDKKYSKKVKNLSENINGFNQNSISIKQWNKFKENFLNEIDELMEQNENQIITDEISELTQEKNTDKISVKDIADKLNLKCKYLIPKLKDLVDKSQLQAEILEEKKEIIVFTEDYYKFKDLESFINNKLLRNLRETVGKFLALYDSCIKKRSLRTNLLELQNRISDFSVINKKLQNDFNLRVEELSINPVRVEYIKLKDRFSEMIKVNKKAVKEIDKNLKFFVELIGLIDNQFFTLNVALEKSLKEFLDESNKMDSYNKIRDLFDTKNQKINKISQNVEEKVEKILREELNRTNRARQFETELREYYVKKKVEFKQSYNKLISQIEDRIETVKFETLQTELLSKINKNKVHLSQLLGTLQSRVEDYIETEQYKKAYVRIKKREKDIELGIKESNKNIAYLIRDFNKISKNFETKNKHLIKDFEVFIKEFRDIVNEKVKSSEEDILRAYVLMAIKAVAYKMLTLNFLQSELKLKKQKIQKHLISLISAGKLRGVYDPRLGVYYEDPEALKNFDEKELELMNKMNFKIQRSISRLKIFVGQYGRILSFFASLFAISYYIFMMTGQNPMIFILAIFLALILITFLLFKKRKEEKLS